MIMLGNINFDEVLQKFGYQLNEDDRKKYNEFYSNRADLSEKESCFHCFDIPRCIIFKGDPAKNAILEMFTPDKLVNNVGRFQVYEQTTTKKEV